MKKQKLSEDTVVSDDSEFESTTQSQSSPAKTTAKSTNSDGEASFEISSKRRVTVRKFRSSILIDIREYYEDKASGEDRPGKKGISLTKEQYEKLKELLPEIDKAVKNIK